MKLRFELLAVVLATTGLITAVNAALPDPGMDMPAMDGKVMGHGAANLDSLD